MLQSLSEDVSDDDWCDSEWDPETSLSGGISSQTPTKGNFDDDDDDDDVRFPSLSLISFVILGINLYHGAAVFNFSHWY